MKRKVQRFTTKPLLLLTTGVCIGIVATVVLALMARLNIPTSIDRNSDSTAVAHNNIPKSTSIPDTAQAEDLVSVLNQINVALKHEHSFDRLVALYAILSPLNSDTLQELLLRSADMQWSISNPIRTDLQTVLIERLVTINPQDAIATVLTLEEDTLNTSTSLMPILVESIESDSDIVGTNPLDQGSNTLAFRIVSKKYSHLPYREQRELATKLNPETRFIKLYLNSMTAAALNNPNLNWPRVQDTVQENYSYISQTIDLTKQWYDSQGIKVLDHMHATMSRSVIDEVVAGIVLGHIASKHPKLAFEYVMTQLHREVRPFTASEVIRQWATQNPSAALAAVNNLDAGVIKTDLQLTAVCGWATIDPDHVLGNLSNFPPHTQIDAACDAIGALATNSPDQAIAWLVRMKGVNMKYPAANTLVSIWSQTDVGAAYKWVLEEPAIESIREKLYEPLAYTLAKTDPASALELARKHPLATGQVGLEASIFHAIAVQDIQVALELLPNVRPRQKEFAYGAVGSAYVKNGDFQKAVNLGLKLDSAAHGNYYQYISYIWVNTDPDTLHEMLPDLPNEEARSKAAYALCVLYDGNDSIPNRQVESLDQYLTENDREILGSLAPFKNP